MIGLFLSIFFIILIFFSITWGLFQFFILLFILLFLNFSYYNFFSIISYNYGIDVYSYGLIVLTMLIVSLIVISSNSINGSFLIGIFLLINLILGLSLLLVFFSLNILSIYFFFEFSLVPLLVLIYLWGYQPERLISGFYLFFTLYLLLFLSC